MGSADDNPLLVEQDGAVLRLTLNRPQRANGLDLVLCKALLDAAIVADEDDAVRCVVLAARGKLFCAGGDIDAFVAAGDALGPLVKQMTAALHMALARRLHMNKPLVSVGGGPAAGAGLSLAILG
ncbi:MAG: enoyl-CoA hydratase/isomerase family protein, partial [Acetobacteraceae bacterium]|nr:enoyl-CoA hydratase/isomerase family protein [Acetobacteraceae bacterium]